MTKKDKSTILREIKEGKYINTAQLVETWGITLPQAEALWPYRKQWEKRNGYVR